MTQGATAWGRNTRRIVPGNIIKPRMTNSTIRPKEILALDFESYYGKHFSLKKLTTTVYVRNLEKDEIHGMGFRWIGKNDSNDYWLRGNELNEFLREIDWSRTAVLAHNASFDGFVLSQHFDAYPAYIYDTLSMARGLHSHDIGAGLDEVARFYGKGAKVAGTLKAAMGLRWDEFPDELKRDMETYCKQDVHLMCEIFAEMLPNYPQDELDLIDITVRAFTDPKLHINKELVMQEWKREIDDEENLLATVAEHVGSDTQHIKDQLSSNQQFAAMLERYNVEVPMKPSPSDPDNKQTYAFAKNDIAFQNLSIHPNREVRELIEARLAVKSTIGQSRAQRVLQHGKPTLPILLNYAKAHTLRWTGGDKINPQNFPSGRTESRLRECLIAPPGFSLVVIDSSQIEDRMNCWVSGQADVLQVYAEGGDNYCKMAGEIYNIKYDDFFDEEGEVLKEHKLHRFVGKVSRLGLGYQCGTDKFTYILRSGAMGPPVYEEDLPTSEILDVHKIYRKTNDKIVKFWSTMDNAILNMKNDQTKNIVSETSREIIATIQGSSILMPNGLKLHYPGIYYDDKEGQNKYRTGKHSWGKIYGGLLAENFIQSLARIVVGEQMLKIAQRYKILMMTHDEVVYIVPTPEQEEAYDYGLECMRWVPDWCKSLPVNADGGYGQTYGEIK